MKRRPLLAIIIFFLLPQLFFVNKAVNIDDVPFLAIARQILRDPLHPYSFAFNWGDVASSAYEMADPPLIMYYQAAVIKLFGEKEIILHLAMLPFSLLTLLCTYRISQYFTKQALLATIMVAVSPAFFVSATTLMMDIPFLALSLLTIFFFLKASWGQTFNSKGLTSTFSDDEKVSSQVCWKGNFKWVILAGLSAGLTSLIKYTAVVTVAIVAVGFFLNRKYRSLLIFLVLAGAIAALWNGYFYSLYGTIHAFYARSLPTAGYVFNLGYSLNQLRGPVFLSFLGGTIFFVTPVPIASDGVFGRRGIKRLTTLVISLVFLFSAVNHEAYFPPQLAVNRFLFFLFLVNGSLLLGGAIVEIVSILIVKSIKLKKLFLAFWLISSFTIPLLLSPFLAVRYLTFPLIPLSILATNGISRIWQKKSSIPFAIWAILGATLWLSLVIAIGDARWANTIRSFIKQPHPSYTGHQGTTWYLGHWGWQYYVERQNKAFLDLSVAFPDKGDFLIRPLNIPSQSPPDLATSTKIDTIFLYHQWPIVTMHWPSLAGWYSHRWGILPYGVTSGPIETISVWQYGP